MNDMRIAGEYRLQKLIGMGAYGDIYSGYSILTQKQYAFKVDLVDSDEHQLENEYRVYQDLAKIPGIPQVRWFGKEWPYTIMAFDLLGPSIEDTFQRCSCKLSLSVVLPIADQTISLLEAVHEHDLIHCDLKAEHLLFGLGAASSQVHLIDFGLAKRYRDRRTWKHISLSETSGFVGNPQFASINAHRGFEQSRRDDLESLAYILVYLLSGSLPWQDLEDPRDKTSYARIMDRKISMSPSELCDGLPEEFEHLLRHARNLGFAEKPDYAHIRQSFRNLSLHLDIDGARALDRTEDLPALPTLMSGCVARKKRTSRKHVVPPPSDRILRSSTRGLSDRQQAKHAGQRRGALTRARSGLLMNIQEPTRAYQFHSTLTASMGTVDHWISQPRVCTQLKWCKDCVLFRDLQCCWLCQLGKTYGCVFKDFRCTQSMPEASAPAISFRREEAAELPQWHTLYSRLFMPPEHHYTLSAIATVLQPLLSQEVAHREREGLIQLGWPVGERVHCDICDTFLFACAWLCPSCGRDICNTCSNELSEIDKKKSLCSINAKDAKRFHQKADLLPVSRFSALELQGSLQAMEEVRSIPAVGPLLEIGSAVVEGPSRAIYMRPVDSFLYNDFIKRFSRGEPVVVTGVHLRGPWKPQSFINLYGKQVVKLVDTETEEEIKQDLAQFFGAFGTFDPQRRSLKLKDWPPTENFKDRFWDHFESFRSAVPFPDLTRPDGIFNLAVNFPENVLTPDLGPKMYNAYGTLHDDAHHSSTRLHMDVTDAVNILAHAATLPDGAPGGAHWTIFHRKDAASLSKFLKESRTPKYEDVGDPIHSQTIYLTPRDLQLLEEEHHIVPYVFTQKQGDAVFIPSGSPHQV
ncbi:hypothetical protein EVG20_g11042 [Dentipellis fragilis]|uniref:Protein kinase domain-containing protein n=1 Tax=Dentipellis fragilis TaxID=205917 RepID=A0A4Y9XMN0_9AGAM|nr:hypothetical protein EVG20_g11042 [Dentipellis fragilis]